MLSVVNTPDGAEPTEIQTVDDPAPAPNEFVLETRAFSVNRGELSLVRDRPQGWRPGQDIAGTVLAAAADGTGPAGGTRVVALVDGGGWSQKVAVPVARYAPLPDSVSFEQAASLPIAGLTALRTLRVGGELLGRRVLVTGANGGVGRFHVELAAAAGAEVTAITSRADKADELRALGARDVVADIADAPGLYKLVLESIGGTWLTTAVSKVEPRGTVVILGMSSGERSEIGLFDFVGHAGARIEGFVSYLSGWPDDVDLAILVSMIEAGKLHPTLGHVASWRDLVPSMQLLADRKLPGGKLVLTVD